MDEFRNLALMSVGRAVMFSFYAIGLLVLAFLPHPVLALDIGGTAALLLAVALIARSAQIGGADPRRSEAWMLLAAERRPRREAWRLLNDILRETHMRFARWVAGAAALFFAAASLLALGLGGWA